MGEIMIKYSLFWKRMLSYCVSKKRECLLEGNNLVIREKF